MRQESIKMFSRKVELSDLICKATRPSLGVKELLFWPGQIDSIYTHASFDNVAKSVFLRAAAMKILAVALSAKYRGSSSYVELLPAVESF